MSAAITRQGSTSEYVVMEEVGTFPITHGDLGVFGLAFPDIVRCITAL